MESLIKALEELNVQIEDILENHKKVVEEVPEKPKKETKPKKTKTKKEGSVKNGIAVVRFIAPDGKKIQVNFDDTNPSMTLVPNEILE